MTGPQASPRGPSLLRRIVVRLMVVTAISAAIAYGFLFAEFSVIVSGLRQSTLYGEAEELLRHLSIAPDGAPRLLLTPEMTALYSDGEHRFAVLDPAGQRIFQSLEPPRKVTLDLLARPGTILVGFEDLVGVYEQTVAAPDLYRYGALVEETIDGVPFTVQVERTTSHYTLLADTLLDEFFNDGGWLGLPFLAAMMLASIATVAQGLAPLRQVSDRARQITPGKPGERLPLTGIPREVEPLVTAVNGAVDRLEQAFDMQRDFTAAAAHELRTPLAVLKARLDVTLLPGEERAALNRDMAVMTRIVDQLFKVAQLENLMVGPDDRADLRKIACDVGAALAPLAIRRGIDLSVEGPEAPVPETLLIVRGQEETLFNVVRNLLENALFHAPAHSLVSIVLAVEEKGPSLKVIDHGPGVRPEHRTQVFERFWQGRRRGSGAGLGLFIAARTMAEHQGVIEVAETPGGGATFILRFPRLGS